MADFKSYLPFLKNGNLSNSDFDALVHAFKMDEFEFAEHLQYSIYTYCLKNVKDDFYNKIRKLVEICYSQPAINGLQNITRFVGCVASICLYFFKCNEIEDALSLIKVFEDKKKDLGNASCYDDVRRNLFVLHHHFLEAALKLNNSFVEKLPLLDASLKCLEYIQFCDEKISEKLIRNIKHAISNLGTSETENLTIILNRTQTIIMKISDDPEKRNVLLSFLTLRMCNFIDNKSYYNNMEMFNLKCKEEINLFVNHFNLKCQVHWHNIIDYFTLPESSLTECIASARVILKQDYEINEAYSIFIIISSFFTPELWAAVRGDNFTIEEVKLLNTQFVMYLDNIASLNVYYESQTVDVNSTVAFGNLSRCYLTLTSLIRTCYKKKFDGCLDLGQIGLESLDTCLKYILQLSSQSNTLPSNLQSYLYVNAVVRGVNSIEDLLSLVKEPQEWCIIECYCILLINEINESPMPLPIDKDRHNLLFSRWHLACIKGNRTAEAMMAVAAQICNNHCDLNDCIMSWVSLKIATPEYENELMFLEYVFNNSDKLQLYSAIDGVDRRGVVIAEAKAYRTIATPDIHIAFNMLWEHIVDWVFTKFETVEFLSYRIGAIAHFATAPVLLNLIEDVKSVEKDFAELTAPVSRVLVLCCLGILRFSIYICSVNLARIKCSPKARKKILNLLKSKAEKKILFGDDADMNLACDITPAEGMLKLRKEVENLSILEATLNFWMEIPDNWSSGCLSDYYIDYLLDHLQIIANTASLYGAADLTVRAWTLYYRIACLADQPMHKLQALSALIKECELSPESVMVRTALELSEELLINKDIKKLPQTSIETLFTCFISIANIYLNHKHLTECDVLVQKCKSLVQVMRDEPVFLMMKGLLMSTISRALSLQSELECKTFCEFRNHQYTAYSAYHYIKAAFKSATNTNLCSKQHSQLLLTLLDVSTWSAVVFHSLLLTPFVRAFLEDLYFICQSLQFTSRTAQILSIFAEVDLTTRNLADATVKLSNLTSMIALAPPSEFTKEKKVLTSNTLVVPRCPPNVSPLRCMPSRRRDLSPTCNLLPRYSAQTFKRCPKQCSRALLVLLELKTRSCEAIASAMAGDNAASLLYHQDCENMIKSLDMVPFHSIIQNELTTVFPNESVGYMLRDFSLVSGRVLMNFAAFSMLPNSPANGRQVQLLSDAERYINTLTYQKFILDGPLLELKICNYLQINKKNKFATSSDAPLVTDLSHTKTPLMKKKMETVVAPKRHGDACNSIITPVVPPKRGRRIFELDTEKPINCGRSRRARGTPAVVDNTPLKNQEDQCSNVPQSVIIARVVKESKGNSRLPRKGNLTKSPIVDKEEAAVASLRAPNFSDAQPKSNCISFNLSSSDSESTESGVKLRTNPVATSVTKKLKITKTIKTKPKILIFDDNKVESTDGNVSKDLFESFEKKLSLNDEPKRKLRSSRPKTSTEVQRKPKTGRL